MRNALSSIVVLLLIGGCQHAPLPVSSRHKPVNTEASRNTQVASAVSTPARSTAQDPTQAMFDELVSRWNHWKEASPQAYCSMEAFLRYNRRIDDAERASGSEQTRLLESAYDGLIAEYKEGISQATLAHDAVLQIPHGEDANQLFTDLNYVLYYTKVPDIEVRRYRAGVEQVNRDIVEVASKHNLVPIVLDAEPLTLGRDRLSSDKWSTLIRLMDPLVSPEHRFGEG